MKLLSLIFLILASVSCLNKTHLKLSDPDAPASEASALQSSQIEEELKKLEVEFSELGVDINLHKIPVIVKPMSDLGRCTSNDKGKSLWITINPIIFQSPSRGDYSMNETTLYSVLLHEIGHCYFGRQHEENEYVSMEGHKVTFPHEYELVGYGKYRLNFRDNELPKTVMMVNRPPVPRVLRKYYTSEIAGLERLHSFADLKVYTEVELEEDEGLEEITSGEF